MLMWKGIQKMWMCFLNENYASIERTVSRTIPRFPGVGLRKGLFYVYLLLAFEFFNHQCKFYDFFK